VPATPDPELALRLAKTVADLYGDAVASLLQIVAKRLGEGIDQPGWAETKLVQLDAMRRAALAEVERLQRLVGPAITEAITAAEKAGAATAVADLAGVEALEVTTGFIGGQRRAIDALVRETLTNVSFSHTRLLRSTLDVYRTVISEAGAPQVLAGVATRRQAAQTALNRFAARGVTGFVDSAGRGWEIESYTEMATRTAVGRAQVAGALGRFEEAGRDLVIVSDAPQECSTCRPWEGRVLSVSGQDRRYPSVAKATAEGLFHANCRHALGVYLPGVTKRFTGTADPTGDRDRQQQRYLERGVRKWKRVEAAAMDDQAARVARAKAREWQGRLRDHVQTNDLKRRPERERLGAR
jgi:hypothetical protein